MFIFDRARLSLLLGEHVGKHLLGESLLYGRAVLLLYDVEAPEGEEDRHLAACGGCAVGKDECGYGAVEVIAEAYKGLVLAGRSACGGRLVVRLLLPDEDGVAAVGARS